MKTYTIIAGINGTGKSSLTGSLKAQTKSLGTIIDTDNIKVEAGSKHPAWLRELAEYLERHSNA